jgi:acetylornithine deacetylase/succinyl-diaminopimelate desuccinylase-like protein
MRRLLAVLVLLSAVAPSAQTPFQPDFTALEADTLRHFQALVRMDTSDPPGGEKPAADYVKQVLEAEGIPVQIFAADPNRPNVVARLRGSGKKRPLLILGHLDTVNVDPKKWQHGPFSAAREGGYIYGRGTVDDKDNLTAALMVMLQLKRGNVPLDRDVIFLAEAGEEGATQIGIEYVIRDHFPAIDAEFCYAEGGSVTRQDGAVRYAQIQTTEKVPNGIDLVARGVAGHGSVPLQSNAIAHLSKAITAVTDWQPPITLTDTTAQYFKRLATISPPEQARHYRNVVSGNSKLMAEADAWMRANEPRHASMLRTSISPNIIQGGYRNNVIPSDAKVTLDVRMIPDENPERFLAQVRTVINDPAVEAVFNGWPATLTGKTRNGGNSRIDSEAYKVAEAAITKHYQTITLPTMSTGASDMAFLREKGIQCYGIGPAGDAEDGPKGFGAHSDQERILEAELHRFVRYHWDIVYEMARVR